jgi:GntR family transcriptional regulator/MocR family aminotransferase
MTPGVPALSQFPISAWRRAHDRALQTALPAALGYGDPVGEPALREAIAHHLRVSRGVRCDADQVVITEGAQSALSLCVSLLTNPGDTAWLEDPGYRGAKAAFHAGDLNVIAMRVDDNGMAIPRKAWLAHPPRLVQTTPAHQYPTGAVLSISRRLDLIKRATEVGAWIVEDDYDSEFRHQGAPIAAMQGLVVDAPVLYVGSFSKSMFPALRLGFLVLPKTIAQSADGSLRELLRGGHRLEQLAMANFIDSGQFARHLGRMRRLYRERQNALREALVAHLGVEHQVLGGHSGLHLTVRLPPHMPDRAIVEEARRVGMSPAPLSAFAMAPLPEDNGLVIGYGNTSAERFAPLIKRLGRITRGLPA